MTDQRLADRYILEAELARGAAGTVYRALDTATGDRVAVKVLRHEAAAEPGVVESFLDEAEVLSELNHPAIVRPRDFIATDEVMALVMDLVEGTDLRRRIKDGGPLRPADAATIISQVASALAAVHAKGVVHGDVKPGNILVPFNGGSVRLADFGVAHRIQQEYGPTHGTPEYVAPEIVDGGGTSGKADVYGVGLILYEMLSGRSPYRGGPVTEVLKRHRDCAPAPFPGCPPQLWSVITACTQLDPDLRPDAADLPARLQLAQPSLAALPASPRMPEHLPTYRPRDARPEPTFAAAAAGTSQGSPLTRGPSLIAPPAGTAPHVTSVPPAPAPAASAMAAPAPSSKERSRRPVLIGAGVAAVVGVLSIGAFVLIGGSGDAGPGGDAQEQPASSTQESEPPANPSPTTDPASPSPEQTDPSDPADGSESDDSSGDTPTDPPNGNDNGEIPEDPGQGQLGEPLPQFP